jgi:microcompartment protein CcmL/EutN
LVEAAACSSLDTLKYIIAKGADVYAPKHADVFFNAALAGNLDNVKYLMELGFETSRCNEGGRTVAEALKLEIPRKRKEVKKSTPGLEEDVEEHEKKMSESCKHLARMIAVLNTFNP